MTWFVKQHIYKIKKDDKVYVWVTGKDGMYLSVTYNYIIIKNIYNKI